MASLFLIPLLSLVACLCLVPVARWFALKVGLVDRPDGRRKIHDQAVPVTGGLAVFTSVWLAIAVAMVLPHPYRDAMQDEANFLLGLFLGSSLLVAIGIADDFGCLRGWHKLLGQILAIAVVMAFGVNVQAVNLFGWEINLWILAWPCTCFL